MRTKDDSGLDLKDNNPQTNIASDNTKLNIRRSNISLFLPTVVSWFGWFTLGFAIARIVFTCQYEPNKVVADGMMIMAMVIQSIFILLFIGYYAFGIIKSLSKHGG